MTSIKVQHYGAGARKERRAWVKYPLTGGIEERGVLVVDDVNDSGETLWVAAEHLRSFAPAEVRTAVLHEKVGTRMTADHRLVEVRNWHWIPYPCAVLEDVGSFLGRMDALAADTEEVAQRPLREYGVCLDQLLATRVLDFCRHGRGH